MITFNVVMIFITDFPSKEVEISFFSPPHRSYTLKCKWVIFTYETCTLNAESVIILSLFLQVLAQTFVFHLYLFS